MTFYYLNDNSNYTRGAPWINGAYADMRVVSECQVCKALTREPMSIVRMHCEASKGTFWPDVLGSGGGIMGFFVSARIKESLDMAPLRYGTAFEGIIEKPYPKRLRDATAPRYYYLTGELGAQMDFAACGFRIRSTCRTCGKTRLDPSSPATKYQFVPGSWNGAEIFHTDLSPNVYFCTQRFVDLARVHGWTNLRFEPLETHFGTEDDSFSSKRF